MNFTATTISTIEMLTLDLKKPNGTEPAHGKLIVNISNRTDRSTVNTGRPQNLLGVPNTTGDRASNSSRISLPTTLTPTANIPNPSSTTVNRASVTSSQ